MTGILKYGVRKTLVWNDIRRSRMLAVATMIFMAVSAMFMALTVLLGISLLHSINTLMEQARTPDFLQMHTGDLDEKSLQEFADDHAQIRNWQVSRLLNLENAAIMLGNYSLADNTQDNGLCVQGQNFDYLLDLEGMMPEVRPGEVYVPVCYRAMYQLKKGDLMQAGSREFMIAGFIRDAQMNSMMASSKRFLIHPKDYETVREQGQEEYLIEFLLEEGTKSSEFGTAYTESGLPANGPMITKPLIRMMNALSDGTMIAVIFLVSMVILLISLLCIQFILRLQLEKERQETGMLRALGFRKKRIRQLYFTKYILLSVCGATTGFLLACLLCGPLTRQMQELYGAPRFSWKLGILSFLAAFAVETILLLSVLHTLKKSEGLTILEALFPGQVQKKRDTRRQYLLISFVTTACMFLVFVPKNLHSTLSSSEFVTHMGIGNAEIRMDVRENQDWDTEADQNGEMTELDETTVPRIAAALAADPKVERYVVLQTKTGRVELPNGTLCDLKVETGDHTVFPVSYQAGRPPELEMELAVSVLCAEEFDVTIGDTLTLQNEDRAFACTVCGIYSDITNGGKTAKGAFGLWEERPAAWSVLYVTLKEDGQKENVYKAEALEGNTRKAATSERKQWMQAYQRLGAEVTEVETYVQETYGQTLKEIRLAADVAGSTAIFIIFVVAALFMRLLVEQNRYDISLQKALGFSTGSIRRVYMKKGILFVAMGIAAGIVTGNLLGEKLCGRVLQSFGAGNFRFVVQWEQALLFYPSVVLLTAGIAVWIGIAEIERVRAFECCIGKT